MSAPYMRSAIFVKEISRIEITKGMPLQCFSYHIFSRGAAACALVIGKIISINHLMISNPLRNLPYCRHLTPSVRTPLSLIG